MIKPLHRPTAILNTTAAIAIIFFSPRRAAGLNVEVPAAQIGEFGGSAATRPIITVTPLVGQPRRAETGTPLHEGDRVSIVPCIPYVEIIFARDMTEDRLQNQYFHLGEHDVCERSIKLTDKNSSPFVTRMLTDALRFFSNLFYTPPPPRPISTFAIGSLARQAPQAKSPSSTPHSEDAKAVALAKLFSDKVGVAIPQCISTDQVVIPIFWKSDSFGDNVEVISSGKAIGKARPKGFSLDVDVPLEARLLPGMEAEIIISNSHGSTKLPLRIVDPSDIPVPPGTNEEERRDHNFETAHALWLLNKAGPQWRLEALAMLKKVERGGDDNYVAARVIRAAIAGEIVQDLP